MLRVHAVSADIAQSVVQNADSAVSTPEVSPNSPAKNGAKNMLCE